MALARYESVAVNLAGDVIPNATVEVRRDQPGRPVVPLWADRNGTVPLGNPITTDAEGKFGFHVTGGSYYVRIFTGPSQQPLQQYVRRYQAIGTAAERDVEDLATALEAGTATFPTLPELEAFTPSNEGVGGKVTTGEDAGFYHYDTVAEEWVFDRPLFDTLARMVVTGGTADAIEAETATGVADSAVVMLWIEAPATNTGPVTINGKPVLTIDGAALLAGQWLAGRTYWFNDEDDHYKLRTESDVSGLVAQAEAAATAALDAAGAAAGAAGASADSAAEAAGFAAGLNIAPIVPGDAGKILQVNDEEDGSDWIDPPNPITDGDKGDIEVSGAGLTWGIKPIVLAPLRTATLINAMRAAESFGSGVSADGKTFVDLLNSTDTLNMAASSNVQFRKGGIEATKSVGPAADAAYGVTSGSNPGWQLQTLGTIIAAANLTNTGKKRFRATWRSGTGGMMIIHGAFVGVIDADGLSYDKNYPVVPLHFSGTVSGNASAGGTLVSDWADFSIPAGKAIGVFWYMATTGADLRYMATKTQTGWTQKYKVANEPAKYAKTGYTSLTTILGLERIEAADNVRSSLTAVSKPLPLSAAPTKIDVAVFLDCASGDVGDFSISFSRDGLTWKSAALGALYTVNGKIGRIADVDLTSGGGAGAALHWRVTTSSGKAIKITALALRQADGIFTDAPSIGLKPAPAVVTHHKEMTGLGYGDPALKYGRLWGFTQDFEAKGPTRFHIKFRAQVVMTSTPMANPATHPLPTTPVMFTVPLTVTKAASIAALGAKDVTETDTSPATGNNDLKWLTFSSGNIYGTNEHYKEALIDITHDVDDPGAYRFEIWGMSATDADAGVSGHIATNWEEAYGASSGGGFKYNRLEIIAEPLR